MPPALKDGEVVARYNSTRNPANVYEVTRFPDGTFWCSCPGHRFSKDQPKACRHTRRVEQGLDDDVSVAERTARVALLQQALRSCHLGLSGYVRNSRWPTQHYAPGTPEEASQAERLLQAIEAVGLTAPRLDVGSAPAGRSRNFRVITLDD